MDTAMLITFISLSLFWLVFFAIILLYYWRARKMKIDEALKAFPNSDIAAQSREYKKELQNRGFFRRAKKVVDEKKNDVLAIGEKVEQEIVAETVEKPVEQQIAVVEKPAEIKVEETKMNVDQEEMNDAELNQVVEDTIQDKMSELEKRDDTMFMNIDVLLDMKNVPTIIKQLIELQTEGKIKKMGFDVVSKRG